MVKVPVYIVTYIKCDTQLIPIIYCPTQHNLYQESNQINVVLIDRNNKVSKY